MRRMSPESIHVLRFRRSLFSKRFLNVVLWVLGDVSEELNFVVALLAIARS